MWKSDSGIHSYEEADFIFDRLFCRSSGSGGLYGIRTTRSRTCGRLFLLFEVLAFGLCLYKNGILSQLKRETSEGPFNRDYSVVQLEVSPDLKQITRGYVKEAVKGLIREKVLGTMTCEF